MIPLNISFPDFPPSESVKQAIEEKFEKIGKKYPQITSCDVVVQSPHHHHHKGRIFHIQIRMYVPGDELVVSREPEKDGAHEDVYVSIRDAFKAISNQLEHFFSKYREHTA